MLGSGCAQYKEDAAIPLIEANKCKYITVVVPSCKLLDLALNIGDADRQVIVLIIVCPVTIR